MVAFLSNKLKHKIHTTFQETNFLINLPQSVESTKLFICFSNSDPNEFYLYTNCYSCHKSHLRKKLNYNLMSPLLYQLHSFPQSLDNFNKVWQNLHRRLNNFGESHQFSVTRIIFGDCSFNVNTNRKHHASSDCVYYILSVLLNCTSVICLQNIYFGDTTVHYFVNATSVVIPYGVQFDGFRHSVVLGFDEFKHFQMFDLDRFFLPFDYKTWILLTGMTFLMGILFKKLARSIRNTYYWLISVLLEQGDDFQNVRILQAQILIVCWLYATIFIRNFYVSSIYSEITKVPSPKDIPRSFQDVFADSAGTGNRGSFVGLFQTLAWSLYAQLIVLNGSKKVSETTENLERSIINNIRYFDDINVTQYVYNMSLKHGRVRCSTFNEEVNLKGLCKTGSRFTLIHSATSLGYNSQWGNLKLLLRVFSRRKIIVNLHEPPYLSYPKLWTMNQKYFYFERYEYVISHLVESGIYKLINERHQTFSKVQAFRLTNNGAQFNMSVNAFAFVTSSMDTENYHTFLDNSELFVVKLSEACVIFILYGILLAFCCIFYISEHLQKKWSKQILFYI